MSLNVAAINSGSNGNCYYIGNDKEAVLIDAGLSCRETEKRMHRMGLSMQRVKALFISHEHIDHVKGVNTLANKFRLPVYITPTTFQHTRLCLSTELIHHFYGTEPVYIGKLKISPFPKFHDAADPYSFLVENENTTIGVITDIGSICQQVYTAFSRCHAVFLEANYDEKMLEEGRYPYMLKKRIKGGKGHLSNKEALGLFQTAAHPQLSHLFLSHLSRDNNDPDLVLQLFRPYAGKTEIIIASRYKETSVFAINQAQKIDAFQEQIQLSLF